MLVHYEKPASISEIKEALEGSDDEAKVGAMKKAVTMLLNGEPLPGLFITIVRYVLPSEDHTIQKLLLLYLARRRAAAPPARRAAPPRAGPARARARRRSLGPLALRR